jgi:hypothetical protein
MLTLCFIDSAWKHPNIQGLDTFKGKLMHCASLDNDYNLKFKKFQVDAYDENTNLRECVRAEGVPKFPNPI